MADHPDRLSDHLYDALNFKHFGPTTGANKVPPKAQQEIEAAVKKYDVKNELTKDEHERWEEVDMYRTKIEKGEDEDEKEDDEEIEGEAEEEDEEDTNATAPKNSTGGKGGSYDSEELAWLWQYLRTHPTTGKEWYLPVSLAFKQQFHRPNPTQADTGVKNICQAMKASGHFAAGMVCDKAFYDIAANYPRKTKPKKK